MAKISDFAVSKDADQDTRQRGNSIGFLAGTAGGRIAQLCAHAIIARALGAEGFGLYAIAWTVLQLGQAIGHLGLSEGVIRYLPRFLDGSSRLVAQGILRRALAMSAAVGAFFALLLIAGRDRLATDVFAKGGLGQIFLVIAPALAVAPIMQVAAAATRATGRVRHAILTVDAGLPMLLLCGAGVLWLLGAGVMSMAVATSIIFVAVAGAALTAAGRLFVADAGNALASTSQGPSSRELFAFSLSTLSMSATLLLMLWSDRIFVGAFRPVAEVGAYHAASQLSMLFVVVFQPLAAVLAPVAASASWRGDHDVLKQAYQNLYRWGLLLTVPSAILAFEFVPDLLALIYGPEFAGAGNAARVLIAGQLTYLLGGGAGAILVMTGRQGRWLIHALAALLINIVLNFLLVPTLGLTGAAISTAVAFAVLHGGGCLLVRHALGFYPLTRPLVVALLGATTTYTVLDLLALTGWLSLWFRALPAIAGASVLFILALRDEQLREDLDWLQQTVRRHFATWIHARHR